MTRDAEQKAVDKIERKDGPSTGWLREVFSARRSAIAPVILVILIILIFLVYSSVLSPRSFGYYNDDAIYLSTAKALATGHGYRLIDLPYVPAQTKYPPLFPFLLSLIWRLRPDFPANLTALMMVSVSASLLTAAFTWVYMTRYRYTTGWWALVIVGLAAINLNTVEFSVGVFSEMVYTMFAVVALVLAEHYEEVDRSTALTILLGTLLGLAMGFAFLTRVAGITLLIAVGFYFLLRGRLKRAVIPLGVACAFVLAWGAWTHYNKTTFVEPNAVFHTDYLRYSYNLVREASVATHRPMLIAGARMVARNLLHLVGYWIPAETLGSFTDWLPAMTKHFQPLLLRVVFILCLLLIGVGMRKDRIPRLRLLPIYVVLYVGLHLTLPYHFNTYDRYLAPILPFTILYLIKGASEVVRTGRSSRAGVTLPGVVAAGSRTSRGLRVLRLGVAVPVLLFVAAFGVVSYSAGVRDTLKNWKANAITRNSEDAPAIQWLIANTPVTAVIATVQHPMYYMYTGRKATLCFATEGPPQPTEAWQIQQLLQIIKASKVDYLVLTASDIASQAGDVDYDRVTDQLEDSDAIRLVFESPGEKAWIYQCNPDGPSRH